MIPIIRFNPETPASVQFDPFNEDFRMFAITLHGEQKYGNLPYAFHLSCVENVLTNHGYTDYEDRAVAWLHDIIEDTICTSEDLINHYGSKIAMCVGACTGIGANRKERNANIYSKLKELPEAAPYKVADRIANMKQGILTRNPKLIMYIREFKEFSDNIRPLMTINPKDNILWSSLEDTVVTAMKTIMAPVKV